MGTKRCPRCKGKPWVKTGMDWGTCSFCFGMGTVWTEDPDPGPPTEADPVKTGAFLIASAVAAPTFFFTITGPVSGGVSLIASIVVFVVLYVTFRYPLSEVSSGLMNTIEFASAVLRLILTIAMYGLGASILIAIAYLALR